MRAAAVCWMVVGTVALTGCAAEESEPAGEPVRTPPALAAPVGPSVAEPALAAYRGMWDVVVEGSHEGAVGHPELAEYASGQALELTSAMLRGVMATGEPTMSPEVVEAAEADSPSSVSIEDCVDDSQWTVVEESTEPAESSGRRRVTATVVTHDGQWLVDDLWLEDYGSC